MNERETQILKKIASAPFFGGADITPDTKLNGFDNLGLGWIELSYNLEDIFNINFLDEEVEHWETVRDVLRTLNARDVT